jgi:hypothetical protein
MSQLALRPEKFDLEANLMPQASINQPRNFPLPNWRASKPHSDAHSLDEPRPYCLGIHLRTAKGRRCNQ